MSEKSLRLLLFAECNRTCEGCCNNDWDLEALPVVQSFKGYKNIMLTGGEPMLNPDLVINTAVRIREETDAPIYLYTAKSKRNLDLIAMLHILDGITLTLHEQYDVKPFQSLNQLIMNLGLGYKSLNLNVFSNVDITDIITYPWKVKDNIEWIKDCPLPSTEVFMRL